MINTVLTGGFALWELEGFWFAVKEASLPLCLGLFVLGSAFAKRTFAEIFFLNPQIIRLELLQEGLQRTQKEKEFRSTLRNGTLFFSLSFFISAILNFALALHIFKEIEPTLAVAARSQALNEQIAQMTWLSFVVIAFPLVIFTGLFMWCFFRRICQLAGLTFQELMHVK